MNYPMHSNYAQVFEYPGLSTQRNNNNTPSHTMRSNDPSQPGPARYKEYERKREGFRRYLEQYGVLDMITNVLTNMHDNIDWTLPTPPNGLDVFRQLLLKGIDGHLPEEREIMHMQLEVMDLKKANKAMQEELHSYQMQQQQQQLHQQNIMNQLEAKFEQLDTAAAATAAASTSSTSGGNMQQQQPGVYSTGLAHNINGAVGGGGNNVSMGMLAPPPHASSQNVAGTPMVSQKMQQQIKSTPPSVSRS